MFLSYTKYCLHRVCIYSLICQTFQKVVIVSKDFVLINYNWSLIGFANILVVAMECFIAIHLYKYQMVPFSPWVSG